MVVPVVPEAEIDAEGEVDELELVCDVPEDGVVEVVATDVDVVAPVPVLILIVVPIADVLVVVVPDVTTVVVGPAVVVVGLELVVVVETLLTEELDEDEEVDDDTKEVEELVEATVGDVPELEVTIVVPVVLLVVGVEDTDDDDDGDTLVVVAIAVLDPATGADEEIDVDNTVVDAAVEGTEVDELREEDTIPAEVVAEAEPAVL
jgi:hypothetical protein